MSRTIILRFIIVAVIGVACQTSTPPRASGARWASTLCSSQADVVTLQAGPSKDDNEVFAQWKRGEGQKTFALPQRVQNLQKVYVQANNNPPGRETELCVKFDNRPKKRVSFSRSENHAIDANDSDDKGCRC